MMYESETVTLNRGDYTTCTINLHGATVTSWRFEDQEQLFVSRLSRFCGLMQTRGGIAFVFPIFGMWIFGPRHGLARNQKWKLQKGPIKKDNYDVYAEFSLDHSAYTESMWNFKFRLMYKITLCEKKLEFDVYVENLSKYFTIEFQILHHCLFKVPDVKKCEVIGLKGHLYRTAKTNFQEDFLEDRERVSISGWTDRIYRGVVDTITVTHTMNDLKLEVWKKQSKDVNIWNPWKEMSEHLHDLGDDEYQYFIAIEPGQVVKPLQLGPMTCWNTKSTLHVIEPKIERLGHFYDIFDGYC